MYIARQRCNAAKPNGKYPQRHFFFVGVFLSVRYVRVRSHFIHHSMHSSFVRHTRSSDFHFMNIYTAIFKHSLMALSLCDTDFRAFTHIFLFIHFRSFFRARWWYLKLRILLVQQQQTVLYDMVIERRRRHFVAIHTFDMRNLYKCIAHSFCSNATISRHCGGF